MSKIENPTPPLPENQNRSFEQFFEEFNNRTIYHSFDQATLSAIADEHLEQAIMDYLYWKIGSEFEQQPDASVNYEEQEYKILQTLSPGFQAMYTTWQLEAEVNNGGFNQYFWNTDAIYAAQVVSDFERFGAAQHAAIVAQAINTYQHEQAVLQEFKNDGSLEAFSESYNHTQLNHLDDLFYDIGPDEDLSQLRIQYVRANPSLFITDD